MMTPLSVSPAVFDRFPDLQIGVLSLRNIENTQPCEAIEELLMTSQAQVRQTFAGVTISQHPHIASWREAYRLFGVKAKQYPSSIENLVKRISKGETLRSINPLVDLYNIVSMKHLVPVGGEDLDSIQGQVELRFAGEDEPKTQLLGETEAKAPKPGEVIYTDRLGAICRRFNWKEANRTKLTPETKHAILVIEVLPPAGLSILEAALDELSDLVQHYCMATVERSILKAN